jgi:aminoglycoside phosphotransferase (APT) family kinase protein
MAQPPPAFPTAVREAIRHALGAASIQVGPMLGGANQRTFLLSDGAREWIARFERAGGRQLPRIVYAQSLARAAGARVPEVVASDLDAAGPDEFLWMVEERVPGVPFDHHQYDLDALRAIAADTGAQFRCLQSAVLEKWGSLPPSPYPNAVSYRAMTERWESDAERALRLAGLDMRWLSVIREAWALLRDSPPSRPCLCHGDPAGGNLIVSPSHTVTLIDWEWARADDPASMPAYWAFWHDGAESERSVERPSTELLDALLEGYQPEDLAGFRRRVLAHRVGWAIGLIHVYAETPDPDDPTQGAFADPEGIGLAGQKLVEYLRERAWER